MCWAVLAERRIGHAKAGADVLGEEFNRSAIGDRVGLREVLDRFDQRFLTIYVARIGGALALFAREIGRDGDCEDSSHSCSILFCDEACVQYIVTAQDFQLDSAGSDSCGFGADCRVLYGFFIGLS